MTKVIGTAGEWTPTLLTHKDLIFTEPFATQGTATGSTMTMVEGTDFAATAGCY